MNCFGSICHLASDGGIGCIGCVSVLTVLAVLDVLTELAELAVLAKLPVPALIAKYLLLLLHLL